MRAYILKYRHALTKTLFIRYRHVANTFLYSSLVFHVAPMANTHSNQSLAQLFAKIVISLNSNVDVIRSRVGFLFRTAVNFFSVSTLVNFKVLLELELLATKQVLTYPNFLCLVRLFVSI